jgi:hypothetical protein
MSVLERVPVDRIDAQARQVEVGRLLLTVFVGMFWLVGWTARKAVRALAYVGTAVAVGWRDAAGRKESR